MSRGVAGPSNSALESRLKKVQADIFIMHDLVALASGVQQAGMIRDGDMPACKGNQSRLEETANDVLRLFRQTNPQEVRNRASFALSHPAEISSELNGQRMQHKSPNIAEAMNPGWSATVELIP